jgi:branched-chain amino acid transport system permease protein
MKKPLNILLIFLSFTLLILLPYILGKNYYIHMFVMAGIYSMLACSLGLIIGFAGQVSLCHAAFYGIGAYTSALLSLNFGWPFWITFWAGGAVAGMCAFLFGRIVLKFKGHTLAITTALFGIVVVLILTNWIELTKGPMGLPGIPRPESISLWGIKIAFHTRKEYYYLVLIFVLAMAYIIYSIINSRLGNALLAVRENEEVAKSVGIDPMQYKLFAFVTGSAFAGVAGSFYAHYILFISPVTFSIAESINILVMAIFGGIQTFIGPILGAVGLTLFTEMLRIAGDLRMAIYGLALMVVIIFMPMGVIGTIKEKLFDKYLKSS